MRRALRNLLIGGLAVVGTCGVAGYVIYGGGRHEGPGRVHPHPAPASAVTARAAAQATARAGFTTAPPARQILFGDLHVHTTFSADAFMRSLPLMHGEGAHPPADACDYARFCSGLDFFALTDHAEIADAASTGASRSESVRQCNAVAAGWHGARRGGVHGFEWTQVGRDAGGALRAQERDLPRAPTTASCPTRPIAAAAGCDAAGVLARPGIDRWAWRCRCPCASSGAPALPRPRRVSSSEEVAGRCRELCPPGVDARGCRPTCRETAATPAELLRQARSVGLRRRW
jgi:hypothetical protein